MTDANIAFNTFGKHNPFGPEEANELIQRARVPNPKFFYDDVGSDNPIVVGPDTMPEEIDGENIASVILDAFVEVPGVNVLAEIEWCWTNDDLFGRFDLPDYLVEVLPELMEMRPGIETYQMIKGGFWRPLSEIKKISRKAMEEELDGHLIEFKFNDQGDATRVK